MAGRADIAIPGKRVAIYVDGAFWHGSSWRDRGYESLRDQFKAWKDTEWWLAKIEANVRRDRRQTRRLRAAGWHVLRFSDAQVLRNPAKCRNAVLALLSPHHC